MTDKTVEEQAREYAENEATCALLPIEARNPKAIARDAWADGYRAAQPKWVSVKERLPDEHHFVLALYDSTSARSVIPVVLDKKDNCWHGIINNFTLDAFTHWMPLPSAPEASEG
jgi:hypothetical protein